MTAEEASSKVVLPSRILRRASSSRSLSRPVSAAKRLISREVARLLIISWMSSSMTRIS